MAAFAFALLCMTTGCAFDISHVERVPTTFAEIAAGPPSWTLRQAEAVDVGSGFPIKLRSGTRWRVVGRIPQGDVYRTDDQIVTVEASNIFEAMAVTRGDRLVGFYLPVEHSFVAATRVVKLTIEEGTQR